MNGPPSPGPPSPDPPPLDRPKFRASSLPLPFSFFLSRGSSRGILVVFDGDQNSTRRPPREGRKKENCGGRVKKERNGSGLGKKKARNFGPPTLRGPTLLGWEDPPVGEPHPSPTLRGPTFWGHPSGPHASVHLPVPLCSAPLWLRAPPFQSPRGWEGGDGHHVHQKTRTN